VTAGGTCRVRSPVTVAVPGMRRPGFDLTAPRAQLRSPGVGPVRDAGRVCRLHKSLGDHSPKAVGTRIERRMNL
jgi:hypothetical protein